MLVNFKTTIAFRGLKQYDVAELVEVTPTVLSEIVNGRRVANAAQRRRIPFRM